MQSQQQPLQKHPKRAEKEEEKKRSREDSEMAETALREGSSSAQKVSVRGNASLDENSCEQKLKKSSIRRDYLFKLILRAIRDLIEEHFKEK
jgi:hypothetical protein